MDFRRCKIEMLACDRTTIFALTNDFIGRMMDNMVLGTRLHSCIYAHPLDLGSRELVRMV